MARETSSIVATARRPYWAVFLGVSLLAVVGFYAMPFPLVKMVACGLAGVLSAVAILVGVAWYRPHVRWPWYTLAVSRVLYGTGDVWYWIQTVLMHHDVFPSGSDGFYLTSDALLILSLTGLVRARRPNQDRAGVIDALVLSTGTAMLAWVFLMAPYVHETDLSGFARAVSLAYPSVDVLAIGILLRLAMGPGDRAVAFWFLVAGAASMLFADIGYLLMEFAGTYLPGAPLDAFWLAFHALAGAAALHPSMTVLSRRASHDADLRVGPWRLTALATASLAAPAALAIQWIRGVPLDVPVIVFGCVILFLLVIARLRGALRLLSETLETAETQAQTDQLTGLANRRSFHACWERALSDGTRPTALLYVDLDGFKPVNDAFGHEAGDAVLVAVAGRLREVLRTGDVVARLGGDEFGVILPGSSDEAARLVAGRILAALADPVPILGRSVTVGASIGLITAARGDDPEQQLRRADKAMYAAKAAGRGRVVVGN